MCRMTTLFIDQVLICSEIEAAAVIRSAYVASDVGGPYALRLSILLAEVGIALFLVL